MDFIRKILILLFFLTSFIHGQRRIPYCTKYSGVDYQWPCLQCEDGYKLLENTCILCSEDENCIQDNFYFATTFDKNGQIYEVPPEQIVDSIMEENIVIEEDLKKIKQSLNVQDERVKKSFLKVYRQLLIKNPYCLKRDERNVCLECRNNYVLDKNNTCKYEKPSKLYQCQIYSQIEQQCLKCKKKMIVSDAGQCRFFQESSQRENGEQSSQTPQIKEVERKSEKENQEVDERILLQSKGSIQLTLSDSLQQAISLPLETLNQSQDNEKTDGCLHYRNGTCWNCTEGFILNKIVKKCVKVNTNFILESKSVEKELSPLEKVSQGKIDENCLENSQQDNKCLECAPRYYYSDQLQKCEKVNPLCRTWNEDGQCTSCFSNYELKDGECKK